MRTLYLVVSGAPVVRPLSELVERAHGAGWDVWSVSTPAGLAFHEAELVRVTGHPVRSRFRTPLETDNGLPAADAVLAAPMTFATVNKVAQGITDNVAVAMLCELAGLGVPTVAVPKCKPALAAHPRFRAHLDVLAEMGMRVLFDPAAPEDDRMPPWSRVLDALDALTGVDGAARPEELSAERP